jgi:predicted amidophosphoribosyltransferase
VWRAIRPWLFPVWCIGCGKPEVGLCAACAAQATPVAVTLGAIPLHAAGEYDGVLRDAILAVKRGERACLDPLAALLAPHVREGTAIVPVRTTRRRSAERGFDQAVELARRIAERRGGWVDDVLRKHGSAQRGRTRNERFDATGRFSVRPDAEVPSEAIVLDDVLTTGATLRDAIATLTAAGCWVRGAAVVARTPVGRETPPGTRRLGKA